jgi:putative ABC transport system permease protein
VANTLVLVDGARVALAGIVIGGVAALALGRVLARFTFQVSALDPVTFLVAPLLLGAATLLATFVPAHRATRVDPLRVMRAD